jgi:hypothetical protein
VRLRRVPERAPLAAEPLALAIPLQILEVCHRRRPRRELRFPSHAANLEHGDVQTAQKVEDIDEGTAPVVGPGSSIAAPHDLTESHVRQQYDGAALHEDGGMDHPEQLFPTVEQPHAPGQGVQMGSDFCLRLAD